MNSSDFPVQIEIRYKQKTKQRRQIKYTVKIQADDQYPNYLMLRHKKLSDLLLKYTIKT